MDMNKILQNFETAAKGEYTPSKQESSDMKMILESFYEVAADDAKPQKLDEIASVSMSGETADEVAQLVKLLNDAGAPEAAPVGAQPTTMHEPAPCDGPPDMPPKDTMITPKMMDDFELGDTKVKEGNNKYPHIFDFQDLYGIEDKEQYIDMADDASYMEIDEFEDTYSNVIDMARDFWEDHRGQSEVIEDDYANEPNERYKDHETMTLDLSGGINRRKPKGSIRVKDPANFSENSLAEELSSMLKKKMTEKKKAKPDYLDLDKDGDTKEPMKKAAKDAKKKKAPVKESENTTDGKTETIDIGWGEEFKVKHTPQGRLLIGEDISAQVYRSGQGGENAERFIDFVYNMDTKKVIKWPEEMSDEYEALDKEAFLDVVDWISTKVETKLKSGGTKFESENSVQKGSKKNSDTEVDEAGKMKGGGDDPCWKGYKMVGTKKKGGKEVPNCVPREGVEEAVGEDSKVNSVIDDIESNLELGMSRLEKDLSPQAREKIQSAQDEYVNALKDLEDFVNNKKGVEEAAPKNNPVAKNAGKFNKAKIEPNKKKERDKGKNVKHKGKDKDFAMESAPVFDRYVKPLLDKSPKQIVEFYDTEAYAIIDRLSRESRTLANQNVNTRVHDSIVGKLRENLSVLPETKLDEMRRRRSSFDIGRTGYGPGGDLGAADKRDFKRREMEVELGDEPDNNYGVSIDGKPWKVFKSQRAAQKAAATIKSKYGKDTRVFLTAAPATS